jgi:hypothetical protein
MPQADEIALVRLLVRWLSPTKQPSKSLPKPVSRSHNQETTATRLHGNARVLGADVFASAVPQSLLRLDCTRTDLLYANGCARGDALL